MLYFFAAEAGSFTISEAKDCRCPGSILSIIFCARVLSASCELDAVFDDEPVFPAVGDAVAVVGDVVAVVPLVLAVGDAVAVVGDVVAVVLLVPAVGDVVAVVLLVPAVGDVVAVVLLVPAVGDVVAVVLLVPAVGVAVADELDETLFCPYAGFGVGAGVAVVYVFAFAFAFADDCVVDDCVPELATALFIALKSGFHVSPV